MLNETDKNLITQYLKGDKKALEILVMRYMKPIYRFAFSYVGSASDAEDITQEVFVKVWKNIKKFDCDKSFKTWIFSIAKNASIDFLRKKKDLPFSMFEDNEGKNRIIDKIADFSFSLPEFLMQKDLSNTLSLAMEKLPEDYRAVLSLRYNDNFTFKEIAESLGESINTVKSRHRRAIIALKRLFS